MVVTVEYECRISLAKYLTEKLDTVLADRRIAPYRVYSDAGFGSIGIEFNKYPRLENFILVHLGDVLEIMTNGRVPATPHRFIERADRGNRLASSWSLPWEPSWRLWRPEPTSRMLWR